MSMQIKSKSVILKTIVFLCVLIGVAAWAPNLFFGRAEVYWVATVPLGIVALICSAALKVNRKYEKSVYLSISIALLLSFPILMFTGSVLESILGYNV